MFKVEFLPTHRTFRAKKDETIFSVARRAGVHLNSSCNGVGTCGKCKVKVEKGEVQFKPLSFQLSPQERREGYVLACRSKILSDVVVFVPFETRLIGEKILEERGEELIIKHIERKEISPRVKKVYVEVDPPSLEDNVSDWQRLERALKQKLKTHVFANFSILKSLPFILRESSFKLTVTLFDNEVILLEPGQKITGPFAVAVDLGTTTLVVEVIDLSNAEVLGHSSRYNPQMAYGEDVISRIIYAKDEKSLKKLQREVVGAVEDMVKKVAKRNHVANDEINVFYVAGNTVMLHLFYGLSPSHIRMEPYVPVTNFSHWVRGDEIGFKAFSNAYIYALPCVASYLGADIVGGLLAAGMGKKGKLRLFMDIGTNGEMVLGNSDWFISCSCSAGPAFEGGGVKHGMRVAEGAIEEVRIDPRTCEPELVTVGDKPPVGICGSGLIGLIAELFYCGLIDRRGKFHPTKRRHLRVKEGESGFEYVVVHASESGTGEEIVIAEADIDNLVRAKAAVFAGLRILVEESGVSFDEIEEFYIAGSFGHYIDVEKAVSIGLLPDLPREKFKFLGNTSILGARLVSLYRENEELTKEIASRITYLELARNSKFMDEYVSALFLPHTHLELFPSIKEKRGDFEEKVRK